MKPRITTAEVLAHPEWARTLYLPSPVETELGRRHLTGTSLRHAARPLKTDRDARRSTT